MLRYVYVKALLGSKHYRIVTLHCFLIILLISTVFPLQLLALLATLLNALGVQAREHIVLGDYGIKELNKLVHSELKITIDKHSVVEKVDAHLQQLVSR